MFTYFKNNVFTLLIVLSSLSSCKEDKLIKDEQAPTIEITSKEIVALDSDKIKNDLRVRVKSYDNVKVTNESVTLGSKNARRDGPLYTFKNLEDGTYEILAKAYDSEGNKGSATAKVVIKKGKDGEGKDTEKPTTSITSMLLDADSDGKNNDLKVTIESDDNVEVTTTKVTVDGNAVNKDGNSYKAKNLSVGTHEVKVEVSDAAGNTTTETKTVEVSNKPDTEKPTVSIASAILSDTDNDEKKNDLDVVIESDDNVGVTTTEVTVDGNVINKNGNTYQAKNLSAGTHEVKVEVSDAAGNSNVETKTVEVINNEPVISYTVNTVVTPNGINEETSGKIASMTTEATKNEDLDGNVSQTNISNPNVSHTVAGQDAHLLEIVGNELRVKAGSGKNAEDQNGNNIMANKEYRYSIQTSLYQDGQTITDTDAAESLNIDIDDDVMKVDGVVINGADGQALMIEKDEVTNPLVQGMTDIYAHQPLAALPNPADINLFVNPSNGLMAIHSDGVEITTGDFAGKRLHMGPFGSIRGNIDTYRVQSGFNLGFNTVNEYDIASNKAFGDVITQLLINKPEAFEVVVGTPYIKIKNEAMVSTAVVAYLLKQTGEL